MSLYSAASGIQLVYTCKYILTYTTVNGVNEYMSLYSEASGIQL